MGKKVREAPSEGAYYAVKRAGIIGRFFPQTGRPVTNTQTKTDTFQGLILALQQYWAAQGCVILQPLDMEVGAGTFHPATFLRAIGPETWNAAYVQPCRRPTDGRYGDNPNRLQHYYQFQVLLKPSPDNIQELYLESLRELGVDTGIHDVRFVEDNWESPTLGAWGLGWEVWLNGMEVTQFTYFQQVGGLECYPVSGEINTQVADSDLGVVQEILLPRVHGAAGLDSTLHEPDRGHRLAVENARATERDSRGHPARFERLQEFELAGRGVEQ